jgi:hypothetical protein
VLSCRDYGRFELTAFLAWAGFILEFLILLRLIKGKNYSNYPYFFAYVACVLFSSISGYIVSARYPSIYGYWYWGFEFLCVILGYSVILEIIEKGLASYEGARVAARVAGYLVFGGIFCVTIAQWLGEAHFVIASNSAEVEKDLRAAELILLISILAVISYYRVPLGKNLRGIILGYGLVVTSVVMDGALRSYKGDSFQAIFSGIRVYSYIASLIIWTVALWSVYPNPIPKRPIRLESDYQALILAIRNRLGATRSHVGKAGRS